MSPLLARKLSWAHCYSWRKWSSLFCVRYLIKSLHLWESLEVRVLLINSTFFRHLVIYFSQKCCSFIHCSRIKSDCIPLRYFFLFSCKRKFSWYVIILLICLICISVVSRAHIISSRRSLVKPSILFSKAVVSLSTQWRFHSYFLSSSSLTPSFSFFHIAWTAEFLSISSYSLRSLKTKTIHIILQLALYTLELIESRARRQCFIVRIWSGSEHEGILRLTWLHEPNIHNRLSWAVHRSSWILVLISLRKHYSQAHLQPATCPSFRCTPSLSYDLRHRYSSSFFFYSTLF